MRARRVLVPTVIATVIAVKAHAGALVLDGHPVSLAKAQTWCTAPVGTPPNWDVPAHPECKMIWRELARRDGTVLYSARYAWPSAHGGDRPARVLTEVVFEGVPGSRVVRRLYAVQEDEAQIALSPLAAVDVGGRTILESRVCMSGTPECASDFAIWNPGAIVKVQDRTIGEIRAQLPSGYALSTNPRIDLATLSGRGSASKGGATDARAAAELAFKLRLEGDALHVADLQVHRPND